MWVGTPCAEIPDDVEPGALIAPHFAVWELYRSETAARHGIDNRPSGALLQRAVHTAREILQPVRNRFGIPFSPNSVYRCQALDRKLKGKPWWWMSQSQHCAGEAVDLEVPTVSNLDLAQWIADYLIFDQLILECHDPAVGPRSGWVHVSLVPAETSINRRQVLSYIKRAGKYVYEQGLVS